VTLQRSVATATAPEQVTRMATTSERLARDQRATPKRDRAGSIREMRKSLGEHALFLQRQRYELLER